MCFGSSLLLMISDAVSMQPQPSHTPEEFASSRAEQSELHATQGDLRGDDGDFSGALQDYKKAAQLDPTSPVRLLKLAEGYAANDLHHKAFQLYQRALETNIEEDAGEDMTDAYVGMGDLCRTFARSAAAVRSYERAVRSKPKQPFLRWKLSVSLATMGLYDRAEGQLQIILEQAPHDSFYHFQLADLYRIMNRDLDSVQHMMQAVEFAPRDDYYRLRLGAALLRANLNEEAVEQFEAAARMKPTNASYQTLLLFAHMKNNQQPEIAVDVDKIELGAYDEDFVNRIQRLALPTS